MRRTESEQPTKMVSVSEVSFLTARLMSRVSGSRLTWLCACLHGCLTALSLPWRTCSHKSLNTIWPVVASFCWHRSLFDKLHTLSCALPPPDISNVSVEDISILVRHLTLDKWPLRQAWVWKFPFDVLILYKCIWVSSLPVAKNDSEPILKHKEFDKWKILKVLNIPLDQLVNQ